MRRCVYFSTFIGDTLAEAYRKPIAVDTLVWLDRATGDFVKSMGADK